VGGETIVTMYVKVAIAPPLATLTLNRPAALNALSQALIGEFRDALRELAARDDLRAVIVTGAGRAFCAGSDLMELHGTTVDEAERIERNEALLMDELETFPLPTIAAVNGYALGGGFCLALSHDFRLASEVAVFGAPEVKLGWNPPFGVAQAVRLLGATVAKELLMSGRNVPAEEALRLGIASRVVPADELLPAAEEFARQFCDWPREGVIACKREVNRVSRQLGSLVRDDEMQAFLHCLTTPAAQAALEQFVARRA